MKTTLWFGHPHDGGEQIPGDWMGEYCGKPVFQPTSPDVLATVVPGKYYVMRESDDGHVEITPV